jgi:hypothetical protein
METTDTPQTTPATNTETAPTPQPSPMELWLKKLCVSREQLLQVFRDLGWDLEAMPPDVVDRPGFEEMFWRILCAIGDLNRQDHSAFQSELGHMNKLIKRQLAQPPPFAMQRKVLIEQAKTHVAQQLSQLAQKPLTPTERLRLTALLDKFERSDRRQVERFLVNSTKALQKKKKRTR